MTNQQRFLEIITHPYDLDKDTLLFLQKMTETYPYCQSFQILLAKNHQLFDKLTFEKQVNRASAYTPERRKFQRYISDRDRPTQVVEIPATEPPKPVDSPDDIVENPLPPMMEGVALSDQPINESLNKPIPASNLIDIVKQRLEEIRKSATSLQSPVSPPKKSDEKEIETPTKELNRKESDSPTHEPQQNGVSEEEVMPPIEAPDDAPRPNPTNAFQKPQLFPVGSRLNRKPDINSLIDKFLKEEPRIVAKRDMPEQQEDLSVVSTHDSAEIISETLAVVYLRQGNKTKALDLYEKLCLKFPEKSSYFAQKIEAIKNEIN